MKNKVEICKIVAQAVLSDARITDSERDFLGKLMDRYELSPAVRNEILSRNIGEDLTELLESFEDEDARNELLVELALAVAVDGEISASERSLLGRVAEVLKVSDDDLALMLEAAIA